MERLAEDLRGVNARWLHELRRNSSKGRALARALRAALRVRERALVHVDGVPLARRRAPRDSE